MRAYYNENDPRAAAWLRELIGAGLIAPGDVDERSIADVKPHELTPYVQHHFFAGIGGWSYALRLAGVPDSFPVRTGSCPCQPFSDQGKRLGFADPRHLWPVFRDLIAFGEPTVALGEQVASSRGREWLSHLRTDMEGLGYEVGASDLCAAGIGAPERRQRLYWVANPAGQRRRRRRTLEEGRCPQPGRPSQDLCSFPWPDHAGSGSTLPVSEILAPSHGVPGRVGLLRGYGNAIVPQVAAVFIRAALDAIAEHNTVGPAPSGREGEGATSL